MPATRRRRRSRRTAGTWPTARRRRDGARSTSGRSPARCASGRCRSTAAARPDGAATGASSSILAGARMMAVSVTATASGLTIGAPVMLFEDPSLAWSGADGAPLRRVRRRPALPHQPARPARSAAPAAGRDSPVRPRNAGAPRRPSVTAVAPCRRLRQAVAAAAVRRLPAVLRIPLRTPISGGHRWSGCSSDIGSANYASWRKGYDAFEAHRPSFGVTGQAVYQDAADPEMVTVTHDFATPRRREDAGVERRAEAGHGGGRRRRRAGHLVHQPGMTPRSEWRST